MQNAKESCACGFLGAPGNVEGGEKKLSMGPVGKFAGQWPVRTPPFPTVLRILFCVNRTKRAATAPPGPNYASLLAYAGSRQSSSHWQQSRFKLDHSVGITRRNLHIIQRDLQTFCVYPTPSLCSMTANSRQLSVLGESASASVHWVGYECTAGSASPFLTSNIAIEICTSCKSPTHRHLSDNHSSWVSD